MPRQNISVSSITRRGRGKGNPKRGRRQHKESILDTTEPLGLAALKETYFDAMRVRGYSELTSSDTCGVKDFHDGSVS